MHSTHRRTFSLPTLGKHPKRNRWAILLALASFLPFQIGAQANSGISGRITDGETGQALAGAHISLPGTAQGAVSRADGSYRLSIAPGRHVVFISYVGYAPRRDTVDIVADQSVQRDYSLVRGVSQLDPAVVVVLGATAGQALFGSKFRVGAARDQVLDLNGRAVIATIHPSAVLRVQEPADRDEQYIGLVADLRRAVEVSEKENR